VSSVGGAGRRRPLRPGCRQDSGAGGVRRGVGRHRRSLGRGCVCVRNSQRARGGVHLGGGGNHGDAQQGRTGRWRCLNRPGSHRHERQRDAAVLRRSSACARTDRTTNGLAVRHVHGARTARRRGGAWRAGFDAPRGAGRPGKGARLGWCAASIGGGLGRGRRGG
jgi:hypothetical protein